MPNGRALPTALLFDDLLGRAWQRAQQSVNAATALAAPVAHSSDFASISGEYDLEKFEPVASGFSASVTARDYDKGVADQIRVLQDRWAIEMEQVLKAVAPVGQTYGLAMSWLGRSARGEDALGYLGQDHRMQQLKRMQTLSGMDAANPRGLPMPGGAAGALSGISTHLTGIALSNLAAQMAADRESARMAMQIEAAELLMRLRTGAIDAAIDYVNSRMSTMLDVYGRNNDYRTELEQEATTKRTAMQAAISALNLHESSVKQAHASAAEGVRQVGEINDRMSERAAMLVDSYVRRMRRYASRATSALNSAGVSVTSNASESNTVDAQQ